MILAIIVSVVLCDKNDWMNIRYEKYLSGREAMPNFVPDLMFMLYRPVHTPDRSAPYEKVFKATVSRIIAHNKKGLGWTMGINDFADVTWQQFKGLRLMAPQNCSATEYGLRVRGKVGLSVPAFFDWREKGMVSPVKDQGNCGSCWTFSTVGAIESHWNILRRGKNDTFSEQQLVDCAQAFDNDGCEGGLPSHAFEYIRYAPGLQASQDYPYTAKDGQCQFNATKAKVFMPRGSFNITAGD
jgi:cathepsin H